MRLVLTLVLLTSMACTPRARVRCPMVARLIADGEPLCTAFAVASAGGQEYYTAAHCIEAAGGRELMVSSGPEVSAVMRARLAPDRDIAFLTLVAPLASPRRETSVTGKEGLLLSCDGGEMSVRRLAALGKRGDTTLVAGRVCPGDSGSPVIDSTGRVIGLISRADLVGADGCAEGYVEVVHLGPENMADVTGASAARRSE